MTLIQSLDAHAVATGNADLIRLVSRTRDQLERFEEVAQALDDLLREARSSVAFQVRPAPFAEAIERADRLLALVNPR